MAGRGGRPLNPVKVGLWLALTLLIIFAIVRPALGRQGGGAIRGPGVVRLRGGDFVLRIKETALLGLERFRYRRAVGGREAVVLTQPLLDARGGAGFLAVEAAASGGHPLIAANLNFAVAARASAPGFKPSVLIVEQPGKIPYLGVGCAGRESIQAGLNQAGVAAVAIVVEGPSVELTDHPLGPPATPLAAILATARNLEDALAQLRETPPGFDGQFLLADLAGGVVVACSKGEVSVQPTVGGLALVPSPVIHAPASSAALSRHQRLTELTTAHYGYLDPEEAVEILRDRFDTDGRRWDPAGDVIASETTVISVIIDPVGKTLWVAVGAPAPLGRFTAFSSGGAMPGRSLPEATAPSPTYVKGAQAFEADLRALDDLIRGRYNAAAARLNEAITLAETAAKPKPGVYDPEAMGPPGVGRLYLRLGDARRLAADRWRPAAIEAYQKALAAQLSRDDRAYGHLVLATLMEQTGQVKEATTQYRAALDQRCGRWAIEETARQGLARLGQ